MRTKQRSDIGLQYNIAASIIRSAEARGLDAMATGGGCDYITRALGDKDNDPRMVLGCADDAGSPDSLSDKANVTLYLNDEDWSDGGFISFNFDTTVDALDFMAGFNDAVIDLKGHDEPLSCRSCGRELGSTPHCEECLTYRTGDAPAGPSGPAFSGPSGPAELVETVKRIVGLRDYDQPNGIVPEPAQGWDKIEGGREDEQV